MDHDVSARGLKEALEATPTVGRVDVARAGPDENGGFTWAVTFLTELGDLPPLRVDAAALSGTAPYGQVAERDAGVFPPFDSLDPVNGLPLGSTTLTTLDDLAATVSALEQGIPYYFRVSAMNANGQGPAALASPAFAVPLPQAATAPSSVRLAVVDGGSLAVAMAPPLRDGGEEIDRCARAVAYIPSFFFFFGVGDLFLHLLLLLASIDHHALFLSAFLFLFFSSSASYLATASSTPSGPLRKKSKRSGWRARRRPKSKF